ncbi:hypothetical protein FEM48_Zijuj05G0163200 [Ziziphus jujuba var. spinosa]|uniref:Protein kinase domain-containing protein n=1 Tax=Ziziphus jujuba var. spinosa TaxID=714518 RepID=A0A978VFU7_ZIZJJ|nr:hypothetical protein FEM48_Zijuj05G0163200 [Ziziphus jujuba var. spinosa]
MQEDIWSLVSHFPPLPAGQRPDWATLMCAACFRELPGLPENVSGRLSEFHGLLLAQVLQQEMDGFTTINLPILVSRSHNRPLKLYGERKRKLNLSIGVPELAVKRSRFVPSVSVATSVFATTALFSSSSDASIFGLDFDRIKVLGHGISGTVYKVCHKTTSIDYALKVVHGGHSDHLLREIDILRGTDSPHVVRCHALRNPRVACRFS